MLHLSSNDISDDGAAELAAALQRTSKTSKLRELHLANNGIETEGAVALATALRGNAALEVTKANEKESHAQRDVGLGANKCPHREGLKPCGVSVAANGTGDLPPGPGFCWPLCGDGEGGSTCIA